MSSSSGESPNWVREFKAPDIVTFSLSSDTSPENSPKVPRHEENEVERRGKKPEATLIDISDDTPASKAKNTKTQKREKKRGTKDEVLDVTEDDPIGNDVKVKPVVPLVSSRLPLVLPEKVQRSKALVECDGDSIDLSGDVGAVGRIMVSNGPSGNHEMLLDLKGTIYKSTIVPSRTFCVVNVGQAESKIEAIMNDFVRLEAQSNMFEAETMIEGTLDGFSFDSDEEGEKLPKVIAQQRDQNNEKEDQGSSKTKRKTQKSLGSGNKKAKASVKAPKKVVKKAQVSKRIRKSKK